jgi:hypothetical protein
MQESSNIAENIGDDEVAVHTQHEFTKAVGLCPAASQNAPVDKEKNNDQVGR